MSDREKGLADSRDAWLTAKAEREPLEAEQLRADALDMMRADRQNANAAAAATDEVGED